MQRAQPSGVRHQTKQAFVYQTLRNSIMQGELAPGERLRTDDLAQRLGVSSIPVREALQVLQTEGLVETVPHVGSRVARISPASVTEVFTVMEGLELVASRTAAANMTPAHSDELTALLEAMDAAFAAARYEEWGDLNTEFHRAIAQITDMPMLQEMMDRALSQWDRVRRYYLKGALVDRLRQAQEEHYALVQAMRDRDYPLLERVVRAHNRGALAAYMAYLTQEAADASA
jgi:DNA-binding GntR family transcriptional regulator